MRIRSSCCGIVALRTPELFVERDMFPISWAELTKATQDRYLTVLWQDGHSEKAIADFFNTTKGRIVRRRSDIDLKNEGRPATKSVVDPERFQDLLDLEAMDERESEGIPSIAPPPPRCTWPLATATGSKACGKDAVPGHALCEEHLAYARKVRI